MYKLFAIIEETIREARARKTLIGVFIISSVLILLSLLIFQSSVVQDNVHRQSTEVFRQKNKTNPSQEKSMAVQSAIQTTVEDAVGVVIAEILFFFTVCIGLFATAGLTTSIFEKGSIDLLISKPVPRWLIILGRYIGSVAIIFIEVTYFVLGLWVVAGISFGTWGLSSLSSIAFVTLGYAGLFALVTLFGVLWKSSWLAIILGLVIYFITGMVIPLVEKADELLQGGGFTGVLGAIAKVLHWVLPPMSDVASNMHHAMIGQPIEWIPIVMTVALGVVYLSLASFSFARKEF